MNNKDPFIIILGTAQDGGIPHCGCKKSCCAESWINTRAQKYASCLGIIDPISMSVWLVDITLDFKYQLNMLANLWLFKEGAPDIKGIFITHGHVGHYSGLLFLEKAIMNSKDISVYAMTKMRHMLESNRPWKDLITNRNIKLFSLSDDKKIRLNDNILLTPFLVQHRDEYTETVGFIISGPRKKVLYIPDIDSWKGFKQIDDMIRDYDFALIDGTFFDIGELPNRNIKEVPHPFISCSLIKFNGLSQKDKSKIRFIHLNHTNPVLKTKSKQSKFVHLRNFTIASQGDIIKI